jgi:hypothetical protein
MKMSKEQNAEILMREIIRNFVDLIVKENKPIDCLSIGASLLVTTVSNLVGKQKAETFANGINELLSETLEVPFEMSFNCRQENQE